MLKLTKIVNALENVKIRIEEKIITLLNEDREDSYEYEDLQEEALAIEEALDLLREYE